LLDFWQFLEEFFSQDFQFRDVLGQNILSKKLHEIFIILVLTLKPIKFRVIRPNRLYMVGETLLILNWSVLYLTALKLEMIYKKPKENTYSSQRWFFEPYEAFVFCLS